MGPGPKWFDSRNPEKKIKRGTGPKWLKFQEIQKNKNGARPKWLNPEIRKSLMGTGPRDWYYIIQKLGVTSVKGIDLGQRSLTSAKEVWPWSMWVDFGSTKYILLLCAHICVWGRPLWLGLVKFIILMMHARLTINVRFDGAISYDYRYPGDIGKRLLKVGPTYRLGKGLCDRPRTSSS